MRVQTKNQSVLGPPRTKLFLGTSDQHIPSPTPRSSVPPHALTQKVTKFQHAIPFPFSRPASRGANKPRSRARTEHRRPGRGGTAVPAPPPLGGMGRHGVDQIGAVAAFAWVALLPLLLVGVVCPGAQAGHTSEYRRQLGSAIDMPLDADVFRLPPGYNAPEQVHITQGNLDGTAMIISWVTTSEPGSTTVIYGTSEDNLNYTANGKHTQYTFYNYTSGYIHHCTIKKLEFDTKYYYAVGIGQTVRKFWFMTPPESGPDVPYTFGLIGDLGQSFDSNVTLTHYESNAKAQAVLFVGDLSYADNYPYHDNVRWDTWARFVERNVAYQPWIWTAGNHEIDFAPELGETKPFKPFSHRYPTPYKASGSTAPYWYSIKRASAYIIVLASYSAYGKYTPQYKWLEAEFPKVNRSETPWLIVLMHAPWYNSYNYHYMEGETMRVMYEPWFVKYKVDVVFAGHVHAYERTHRISNVAYNVVNGLCTPIPDQSAPVYITIGDGGNQEGLATNMSQPQPSYSVFREASFGHAILDIKNRTHAYYTWHRNQDGSAVAADSMWFTNRYWEPTDDSADDLQ